MNIQFSEEQKLLQDTIYKWALHELGPIAEKVDDEDWMPEDFFHKAGEIGALGVAIDPEYGGSGLNVLSEILVIEQMTRISPALALSAGAHSNLCAGNIHKNANDYLKRKYLPAMVTGEKIGALALTEPNAGSDAMSIRTRAQRDGDCFVLNGTKMFITNGPIADVVLVYAKTEPERGPFGISAFIVEKDFEGFSVGRKIKKAGMRGSPTSELIFDNCRVPAENLLGELNRGVEVMTQGLDIERIMGAAMGVGSARQALDYSIKYSLEREQFGKKISEFQMIQSKLADMYALYEAAQGLTYRAAVMAEEAKRGGKGTDLTRLAAAAVMFATTANSTICSEAVQIHGGYGYCLEFPVQRLWRDAKLMEIGAGTTEIRKLIIARELLRKGSV
ncbi:MAG: acyl-CoA dehydrogenase family protein [Desulfomonile tiedjei]|uniref:Acyl-CoA dehydrogenase family protein n=1 Tax=Desulfomonile tiedjei TaxID=2358 RepID=A0A9D6UY71_9BACT|nr:acyl-CoA dehydrogenase family protein [Desulfomonile tiedjei]